MEREREEREAKIYIINDILVYVEESNWNTKASVGHWKAVVAVLID